jgi:hypothetical protein
MKTTLFLRIAAVLTFIHAALHTIGGVLGKAAPGEQQAVVDTMKAHQFLVMGAMRSYWDFHIGMGLAVSVLMTAIAVALWQIGSLAKWNALAVRPMMMTFLLGFVFLATVSWRYFFAGPVVTEVLIAASLGMAIASAKEAALVRPVAVESRGLS